MESTVVLAFRKSNDRGNEDGHRETEHRQCDHSAHRRALRLHR
jgi:hypothetical protein